MWKKCLLMAGVLVLLSTATAFAQRTPVMKQSDMALINDLPSPPEYWLGLNCMPVLPALRAQLELSEDQGLLVAGVWPESPAAKSGVARYDILWSVGGKPLDSPRDLVQALEAAKDGKMAFDVIRVGKHVTIEVTPEKRPDEARRPMMPPIDDDLAMIQKWLEGQWPGDRGKTAQRPFQFRFIQPGAIVPRGVHQPMPANMTVSISKEGEQPAKIVVKRGDEQWETTEKELNTLPDDVRPFVERMLGRGPFGLLGGEQSFNFAPEPIASGAVSADRKPGAAKAVEDRMEQRLEEMRRQMDRLGDRMEELGHGRNQSKTDKTEKPAEGTPK